MKHAPQITETARAAGEFAARHKLSAAARPVHVAYLSPEAWRTPAAWGVCEMPPQFEAANDHTRAKMLAGFIGDIPRQWQIITHAISVRQPWAWAIMEAGKDLENRSAEIARPAWYYLHAGSFKGPNIEAYEMIAANAPETLPPFFDDIKRGGIIGAFQITGWTRDSQSPWFIGPKAAEIGKAFPLPFIPCPGKLGRFRPFL